VIKMVQALRHETLPATLHVDGPTPHVEWPAGTVRLLTRPVAWPRGGRTRRAAVSSFGISGTNAHLILEEAPPAPPAAGLARPGDTTAAGPAIPVPSGVVPVPVSGQSRPALAAQAARLTRHLDASPGLSLGDIAHALCATRAKLPERAVVLARDRDSLRQALAELAEGRRTPGAVTGTVRDRPKVAFLLPGQGSQRIGLGRALRESFPPYAAAFDAVCAHLDRHLDRPLASVLFAAVGTPEAALLDQTSYAQPALFAVEVALGRLLEDFGVRPDVVLGHSIGEIAGVHLAGALTLEDSCALVTARGRLMQAQPAGGAMVAIEASEAELRPALAGRERHVALAAVNGPAAAVVSGDAAAVLELAADWQARGRRIKRLTVSHAFHSPHMDGAAAELGRVADGLAWEPPRAQVISTLTGAPVTVDELGSPDYWAAHARQAVRFGDGVRWLAEHGVTVAIELGGEGTLSGLVQENLDAQPAGRGPLGTTLVTVPALRTPRPEAEAFTTALAQLQVHGADVDLGAALRALGHRPPAGLVPLPTTAFQRRRYWLDVRPAGHAPGAAAPPDSLAAPHHPVLATAVPLAEAGGWVFTGRLSRRAQPWLADHAIEGTAVVPGIALLELALHAGRQVGCPRLDEMTFQSAMMLPEEGDIEVQIGLGAPQGEDECPVTIHSRQDGSAGWVRNATGRLTPARPGGDGPSLREWPPEGAEPVSAEELYRRLAGRGYTFGPAFRSLRAAWRRRGERGDEWFTEVRLPAEYQADAHRFEVHPALLDSAAHLLLEAFAETEVARQGDVPVLFAVEDIQVDAPGAATLRARLTLRSHDTMELVLADGSGEPVARVGGLTVRAMAAGQLPGAAASLPDAVPRDAVPRDAVPRDAVPRDAVPRDTVPQDALFRLRWSPRPALAGPAGPPGGWAVVGDGAPIAGVAAEYPDLASLAAAAKPPRTVLIRGAVPDPGDSAGAARPDGAVRRAVRQALALAQDFLAEQRLAGARLVMVTSGAVAAGPGDRLGNLPGAAVWGLLRTAQSEHPGRFTLVDLDDDPASWRALPMAVASGEPQLALRAGVPWVPHLVPVPVGSARRPPRLDPAGTVLVTGAGGALGRQVARHLVTGHGVRHLLLLSRAGRDDRGLAGLAAEVAALGAVATVAACDVADRTALAAVLGAVPREHPLTAIFHTAGVLADGLLTDLTGEQADQVLRPKAGGALNLLDLTRDAPLADIVLFSSVAAILGHAGQANYAAANAVLDALAEQGRSQGRPVRSLAWGPWADPEGMAGRLDAGAMARLRRLGLIPLSTSEGLALLDATGGLDTAVVLPVHVDVAALGDGKPAGVPGLLHGLSLAARPAAVPPVAGTTAGGTIAAGTSRDTTAGPASPLRDRLADLDEESRGQAVLDLVAAQVADALGHADAEAVDPGQPFLDLGFNSLMAVELRNELAAAAGLRLPATLVFEFPTPIALARHLLEKLTTSPAGAAPAGDRPRPILALEPI
jgi:pimaricinolide synthase PimS1